jgi:3-oxoacyl-[acyl-carrier protein] reductase
MDLRLNGLNVLVTGGTSGIGAAIVERFAQEGANVAFCSRSPEKVDRMLERLSRYPVEVTGKPLDVTDTDAFIAWAQTLNGMDIFVPNVSALSSDWDASLATDLKATVRATEALVPKLRTSATPAITYIGSKAGSFGTPHFESYGAVKAAMTHYMKSLARRLAAEGVRVNTVSPGDIFVTDGFWDNMRRNRPEVYQETLNANPLGRLGTPEEIANVVVFLSSPAAGFVSGANLLADGASTLHVHG